MARDIVNLQDKSGRVAFVRMKVLSAVVTDRRGLEAKAARKVDGRAVDRRREAIVNVDLEARGIKLLAG